MAPRGSWFLALLFVALAGCASAPEAPAAVGFGKGSAFSKESPIFGFEFFNLSAPADVRFSFDVGDGGSASACFVEESDLQTWMELQWGVGPGMEYSYTQPDTWACAYGQEAATGAARLEAGSYAFAIHGKDCEYKDCRLRWGTTGYSWNSTSFASAKPREGWRGVD